MAESAGWFRFCGTNRSAAEAICTELARSGLHLVPFDARDSEDHGVVCFSETGEGLLRLLRDSKRTELTRVLALRAQAAPGDPAESWRLLHAGAAEVVNWDKTAETATQIKARFDRWNAIDSLTESPSVLDAIVGESVAWRALVRRVVEAAHFSQAPILLTGESGTGKELLARLVHLMDKRAPPKGSDGRDLVTVDCTTLAPELSGSELFGHERGAFTGAMSSRDGAFALADGATLFLDEVGELPLRLQSQLLRAIQEKTYKRVGGNVWHTTDFRLVCATNRDLTAAVGRGEFRVDLYYRIAGWVFHTPPLRERPEDIIPLANHFLREFLPEKTPPGFDPSVRQHLRGRAYHGNVRELRQLVQRLSYRHVGPGPISAGDIPEDERPGADETLSSWKCDQFDRAIARALARGAGLKEITQAAADTAFRIAIEAEKGNHQQAAQRLGVTVRAVQVRVASAKTRPSET